MPEYVVEKITEALNTRKKAVNDSDIIILGVAYKRDISDLRESPALDVIRLLQEKGANVRYCDPYVSVIRMDNGPDLKATPLTEQLIKSADCIAIITDHSNFNYQWVVDKAQLVVDTRNATKNVITGKKKIFKL
jgi:UDP-N-acetyl-D-glucosamine dehydrogenase